MMRAPRILLLVLSFAALIEGCDPGSEEAFLRGRSEEHCIQNLPACLGKFAACELTPTTYARRRFPDDSPFLFFVESLPDEKIEVTFYFITKFNSGEDTTIYWYEPGCQDWTQPYESNGEDLFLESEDAGTVSRSRTVRQGGDHLIEISSDMQAVLDVVVDVTAPTK